MHTPQLNSFSSVPKLIHSKLASILIKTKFPSPQNGLLSSLPYLGKYIMAVVASYLADYLRQTGKLTTTQTRKSFTAFAVITPGLLMIAQVFFGMDRIFAVVLFTLQLLFNGAVTAGYLGNGLDIAPNFSGTIFGMANTLSSLGGTLSAYMVGALTEDDVSKEFFLCREGGIDSFLGSGSFTKY